MPSRARVAPEVVLFGLTILCLALLPLHILTAYSGLPAHPLFLHVPVILIPVAALGSLALVARPRLVPRYGVPLGIVATLAVGGTFLAAGAGKALRERLFGGGAAGAFGGGGFGGGGGNSRHLIAEHAHAANILEIVVFLFAIALIALSAGDRAQRDSHAFGALTRYGAARSVGVTLRVLVAALALTSIFFVVRTGDLGAKAVWQDRLNGGGGGSGNGGFGGGGFGGSGSGQGVTP